MKIMFVGGTFGKERGIPSGIAVKFIQALTKMENSGFFTLRNGGRYDELNGLLDMAENHDVVFWWPKIEEGMPEIPNVKERAPHVVLVTLQQDDNDEYSFETLMAQSADKKASLTFKFKRNITTTTNHFFHISVFDAHGCVWYEGDDVQSALHMSLIRLQFLVDTAINKLYWSDVSAKSVMALYDEWLKNNASQFTDVITDYAARFEKYQFLGCASMRPQIYGSGYVFVTEHDVDEKSFSSNSFVPVYSDKVKLYCCGDRKPANGASTELVLYNLLPNINYMIYSCCYIEDAPFVTPCMPIGAAGMADEICDTLARENASLDCGLYMINLNGRGSLVMSKDVEGLKNIPYYERVIPERMYRRNHTEKDI